MRTARTVIAIAALALVAAFGAQAQQKAPDKAAQTTGEMTPQQKVDEGVVKGAKPAPSTTKSADVKKEAQAAKKAGQVSEGECDPQQKADAGACKKPAAAKSTTTRDEKKKEGAAAAKANVQTTKGEKP
jgi:FlaG/FlaF family flagellin (archaellin)